ncbi:glycerophosphoryl diester phosphodiesterase membrane domain-containing protein [Mycoplasma sp. P36-A1]|uniref:glycerophosphoryl diester phosphodiesterase membrane domain-containing protein n=1 Tax=Mycoplasma sp. P36-A1 TaxID=3252900 RepID=UPI003C2D9E4F
MNSIQILKDSISKLLKHPYANTKYIALANILTMYIFIPLLRKLALALMKISGITYISYDNIFTVFKNVPLFSIIFIVLFIFILILLYIQFYIIIITMQYIRNDKYISSTKLLTSTVFAISCLSPTKLLFTFFYLLIFVPLAGFSFYTKLLANVRIPDFIMEFITTTNSIYPIVLGLFYILVLYVAIRLVLVLPLMMLENIKLKKAINISLKYTKKKLFFYLKNYILIFVTLSFAMTSIYFILLAIQLGFDNYLPSFAYNSSLIIIFIMQGFNYFYWLVGVYLTFSVFFNQIEEYNLLAPLLNTSSFFNNNVKLSSETIFITFFTIISLFSLFTYNSMYLQNVLNSKPLSISHRGISNKKGVENTIQSFNKAIKYKPDYVEIDIQLTKDDKFVVYHDKTLKGLTNKSTEVSSLTLEQLTNTTIKQNNYKTTISDFDSYLENANKHKQKLLIEFKLYDSDPKHFVNLFLDKYQKNIITNNHQIQSLSYDALNYLNQKNRTIPAGYIMILEVLGQPKDIVDFYTLEYSTLNKRFIDEIHANNKKVYAWTVSDEESMSGLMFQNIDGIVTTDLKTLQETIDGFYSQNSYSKKLLYYIIGQS